MELKGKKINFLGDSITEGAGASCREIGFVSVVGKKTGAVVRNYGIGGTRIARRETPSPVARWDANYLDRAETMDEDADIVVVFGGTNDFGHGNGVLGTFENTAEDEYTFYGALKSLHERLIRRFPDAEIVFLTPTHRSSEDVTTNEIGLPCRPLIEYRNAILEVCRWYGTPVLDLFAVSGIQPKSPPLKQKFMPDGLHPNDRGAERVADRIIAFLSAL